MLLRFKKTKSSSKLRSKLHGRRCSRCCVLALSSSAENCSEVRPSALQISSRPYGSGCRTSSTRDSISSSEAFSSFWTWASFSNPLGFTPLARASICGTHPTHQSISWEWQNVLLRKTTRKNSNICNLYLCRATEQGLHTLVAIRHSTTRTL